MRANVNILTAASANTAAIQVTGFENAAAAHVAGDWGAHNQVLFYATPYTESGGDTISNGYTLRLQLTGTNTDGTGDGVFITPAILTGITLSSGSEPSIIRQPASVATYAGQNATFDVKAISIDPTTLTYQWRTNGTNNTGLDSTLVVPNVQVSQTGYQFDVIVSNSFGSVTSSRATLTVAASSAGFSVSTDGCFLPDTLITMADGTRRQIKDVKVGDRVVSYSIAGLDPSNEQAWQTWASASLNLSAAPATVKQVFKQSFSGYFRLFDLKVTYEHPLLTRRDGIWKFRQVQDIQKGDFLWKNGLSLPIDSMTYVPGDVDTYNLNVEETDVYLANGFMAHNNFFKSVFRFLTPETAIAGVIANGF